MAIRQVAITATMHAAMLALLLCHAARAQGPASATPAGAPPVAPTPAHPPTSAQASAPIAAAVDPRVEFMAAVARTAGFPEYRAPGATSPYAARVDALFAPHAAHPAIERMRAMRKQTGLSYDAVMSLALHTGPAPLLIERVSFSDAPPRLDRRLPAGPARDLLRDLRDLATRVDWPAFAASEKPLYDDAAERLALEANKAPVIAWFDRVLGIRPGASYLLIAGLLNGPQSYGVGVQFVDGSPEEIRPVIGCWEWDANGRPMFGSSIAPLVAHELCHSYTNALVDRHEAALAPAGTALFAATARKMERQAYTTWKIVMYETLVRALVVRHMRDTFGAEVGDRQAAEDVKNGFAWVPALAAAFDRYDADRTTYPTIDAFMPVVVATLNAEAAKVTAAVPAPKLIKCTPPDDSTDLPPGPATLRLEFDQPMHTDTYSITGAVRDIPGGFALDRTENDGRVWYWHMRLEPGRMYSIGLNGGSFRGFRSTRGVPLEYVMIRLQTRAQ